MTRLHHAVPALIIIFAMAACGGDTTSPGEEDFTGSFTVTVSGDFTGSYEGEAFFGEATNSDGDPVWVLFMGTDGSSDDMVLYFVREGARPGQGSHAMVDVQSADSLSAGDLGGYMSVGAGNSTVVVFSTAGSLVVSESTGSLMEGDFNIQAAGTQLSDGMATDVSVTITGSYSAPSGTVNWPGF